MSAVNIHGWKTCSLLKNNYFFTESIFMHRKYPTGVHSYCITRSFVFLIFFLQQENNWFLIFPSICNEELIVTKIQFEKITIKENQLVFFSENISLNYPRKGISKVYLQSQWMKYFSHWKVIIIICGVVANLSSVRYRIEKIMG